MMASSDPGKVRRPTLPVSQGTKEGRSVRTCPLLAPIFLGLCWPVCLFLFQRRLGSRQPRDGHPVGGTGHVVEADSVAELDAGGFAAMLAADAEFDVGSGLPALFAA